MNDAPEDIKARFAPGEADIQVEVVDRDGRVLGTVGKLEAHVPPGILHRAFSLFLFDEQGRMLLQRRAESKYHSPLLLTNATCSHPLPGEPVADAVERRAKEELGADVSQLEEIGIVIYPDEVDEVVYVTPQELAERRANEPMTEWFNHVWGVGAEKFSKYGFDIAGVPGIHGPAEAQAAAQSVSEKDV